jgi:hypothetical protein
MKKAKKAQVSQKAFALIVNTDESFVRTPKRGKLFLIVDNTKKHNTLEPVNKPNKLNRGLA